MIFLQNELKYVTQLNLLFQSKNVEPIKLFEDLFLLYKNLLRRLVVPSQLEKLVDSELIEFNFREHLMHTASMYLVLTFIPYYKNLKKRICWMSGNDARTFYVLWPSRFRKGFRIIYHCWKRLLICTQELLHLKSNPI